MGASTCVVWIGIGIKMSLGIGLLVVDATTWLVSFACSVSRGRPQLMSTVVGDANPVLALGLCGLQAKISVGRQVLPSGLNPGHLSLLLARSTS